MVDAMSLLAQPRRSSGIRHPVYAPHQNKGA